MTADVVRRRARTAPAAAAAGRGAGLGPPGEALPLEPGRGLRDRLALETGETLHNTAGYVVLGLIAYPPGLGPLGAAHARFADFVPSPAGLRAYLAGLARGRPNAISATTRRGGDDRDPLAMVLVTAGSGWLTTTDRFWGVAWVEELHEGRPIWPSPWWSCTCWACW